MCRSLISLFDSDHDFSNLSIKFVDFLCKNFIEQQNSSIFADFYDSFIRLFEQSNTCQQFFSASLNAELFYGQDRFKIDHRYVSCLLDDEIELKFFNMMFINLNKKQIKLIEQYSNEFLHNIELLKFITKSKLMKYLFVFNSFLLLDNHVVDSISDLSNRGFQWQTQTLIGKLLTPSVLPLRKFKQQSSKIIFKNFFQQ
jgi:hypothetical protein